MVVCKHCHKEVDDYDAHFAFCPKVMILTVDSYFPYKEKAAALEKRRLDALLTKEIAKHKRKKRYRETGK